MEKPKKMPSVRTTVSLPVNVHEVLAIGATMKRMGMSEIVQQALGQWYRQLPENERLAIGQAIARRSTITTGIRSQVDDLLDANLQARAADPIRPSRRKAK